LKNKVDIRYIAQLLGHSSLNTTQCYTHVEISDLKRIHSLTHPREKSL
jgi:site-specific recombinase XerD